MKIKVLLVSVFFAIGCDLARPECPDCACEKGCCSSDSCQVADCECKCKKP